MKRSFNFIFLAAVVMAGCSKKESEPSDDGAKYGNAFVDKIDKANTTADGATKVYFKVGSGCGQFDKFIETKEGNTRTINVQAVYRGLVCTTDRPTRTTTYKLDTKTPGTYYLKFVSGENQFIIDTVVVR